VIRGLAYPSKRPLSFHSYGVTESQILCMFQTRIVDQLSDLTLRDMGAGLRWWGR
jgi:hypothetical protein